jgi:hypothetical protein
MGHNCYIGGWTSHEVNCATVVIIIHIIKYRTNFPNEQIKCIRNITKFIVQIKLHFLNMLSFSPTFTRLLCPNCHLSAGDVDLSKALVAYSSKTDFLKKVNFLHIRIFKWFGQFDREAVNIKNISNKQTHTFSKIFLMKKGLWACIFHL